MRKSRVVALLAALVLGALLPLTSLASATPVTYSQFQLAEFNGDCTTGDIEMAGVGYSQFAGAFESEGYSITLMGPVGRFPNQVSGLTIYFTDPSQSEAFALIVFTGSLRCDGPSEGMLNGPVWTACVFDLDSGTTYRGNGAGRNNFMEFGFDPSGSFGANITQLSGNLRPNAASCDFSDAMNMVN
jgi:hypothetical protein